MVLDLLQNFVLAQYLENKWTDLTKLYITIYTGKIYAGIVSWLFSRICTSVMALDLRKKFVNVQYLENK